MSASVLHVDALPKGKRRWLVRAIKLITASGKPDWLDTVVVTVGLAFASNRRGEVSERDLMLWLESHRDEMPRLLSEAASAAIPTAANGLALTALTAVNDEGFWRAVHAASSCVDPAWRGHGGVR